MRSGPLVARRFTILPATAPGNELIAVAAVAADVAVTVAVNVVDVPGIPLYCDVLAMVAARVPSPKCNVTKLRRLTSSRQLGHIARLSK